MAAIVTEYEYDRATYVIDDYVIQREVGDWVVEQNLDGDDQRYLILYSSVSGSAEVDPISLREGLKLAWVLVRQVVSVAIRRAIGGKRAPGREGGAKC